MSKIKDFLQSLGALASPLSAFFSGTVLTCAAYGLLSSTLALRLNEANVPTSDIGIILAVYYVGYIAASLSSAKIINKVGHIRAFSAYLSILSGLVLMHALSPTPWYWAGLRIAEGYCLGASFMCLESWLNTRAKNENRGIIMSMYMVTTYLGSACGQLMLNIQDERPFVVFTLISIIYSIALVPISLTALPTPEIKLQKSMSLKRLYKISPVGVMGCVISGVMVGSIYTLGALYATECGLSIERTSLFMFFVIIGGMLAQIPVGKISDRMDRRFVLLWEAGLMFFIAPWMHYFLDENLALLIIGALILGATIFVMYPVCVSHVNDQIEDSERVLASGLLISLQSIGMVFGPIAISFAMQEFGSISFLIAFSLVNGAYVLFTLKHITFRPSAGYVSSTPTAPIPVAPTHMFNELAKDDSLLDKAKSFLTTKNH